ncbi:phage tail protein [Cellulomonas soli]|uniref:phage tail protein n=1 Tax=Cellulomonas soli TaxID=931535 RepID=UPI003F852441
MEPYLGEIRLFGGNFAPAGWAMCDGQLLQISENDALFTLIGTTYGGDGQETFGLPDLRGRRPVGVGNAGHGAAVIGQAGGVELAPLSTTQLPAHSHTALGAAAAATTGNPAGAVWASSTGPAFAVPGGGSLPTALAPNALTAVGGGQPHENRPPYLALTFIIALVGIYPSPS